MADKPKTVPDSPPADQTADIAQSEAYETANVVSATAPETGPTFGARKSPDELGTLGPYRVLRELGRGGMGAVYLGFDERLKRKVALKVMLPKYAAVASSKNRFLREARAAAGITHDHIVTIYEADEHGGTPFMAMQLLQGYPLDVYLKKNPRLQLGELLRIGREMALGLAAAHSVGLIHRDIKPGNIWLEAPNGRVKILDFGLAKPTEDQKVDGELTATGVIVGTPAYMPPEQARGAKADFRADLFSLGVVLYRLATGTMPFHGDTMMAMLAAVIADDPPPVRELNPDIPEPLAKLIHEMLEKKPQNRPKSADEVAERLQQIQLGTAAAISLPMQVIPLDALPTTTYAASSAPIDPFAELDTEPNEVVTRHNSTRSLPAIPAAAKKPLPKWPLIALGLFLLVVAALIPQIISIMTPKGTLVIESTDPDVEITVKQGGATIVDKSKGREFVLKVGDDYTIDMVEKDGLKLNVNKFEITRNNKSTVRVVVQRPPPKPKVEPPPSAIPSAAPIVPLAWQGPSPLDALDPARIPASEKLDWQPKELVGVLGTHAARHWGQGWALAISPDGQTIATGGTDNTIRLWDATTLQPRGEIAGLNAVARRIAFSKDGRQFLTLATVDSLPEFVLCDVTKKTVVERLAPKVKESQLDGIPFIAPDGRLLAATHEAPKYDGSVRVIDLKTGALVVELKGHPATGYIWTALSPDGTRFATLHSGHVQLWDAKTGNRLHSWNEMKPGGDNWLAFSPDGKWIAASSGGPSDFIDLHVWDAATGKSVLKKSDVTKYYGMTVAFSRDSSRILIGGASAGISVVEVQSGAIAAKFVPDSVSLHEAVFNADGSRVVTFGTHYGVGGDGILHSYDAKTGAPIGAATNSVAGLESVTFAPDLKSLITHDATQNLRVWNTVTGQSGKPIELTPLGVYSTRKVLPFPDGRRAVVLEKTVTIRDLTTGEVIQELNTNLALTADLTMDGRLLALGLRDEKLELWNVAANPAVKLGSVSTDGQANGTVRFSPDGLRLATEGHDKAAIWDVANGAPKKLYEIETTGTPYAVAWSPDGKSLAYVQGANLSFWSIDAKAPRKKPYEVQTDGEYFANQVLAYHPTGKWVAVIGQKSGNVFLYNPADGTLAKSWTFPVAPTDLAFAADGRHLAIANPNGTVYILRLEGATASPVPVVPLAWNGPSPFDTLDGAKLPESLRFEKPPKELVGLFGSADSRHWGEGMCLAASPDGKMIATGGSDKVIRLWSADTLKPTQSPLVGHTRPVVSLCYSSDGQRILSCGDTAEMKFRLWDAKTGRPLEVFEMLLNGRASNGIPCFGPGGQPWAIPGNGNSFGGRLVIYDLTAKKIVYEAKANGDTGYFLSAVSRDGSHVAIHHNNQVRVWKIEADRLVPRWEANVAAGADPRIAFSPDGKHVAASTGPQGNAGLRCWDTESGKAILEVPQTVPGNGQSLAFSKDGKRIVVGGRSNNYLILDFPSGKSVATIEPPTSSQNGYGEAVFNSTGSHVVSFGAMLLNGGDGVLRSYDAKTGQPAIPLPTGPIGPITSMALSNDLTQLFTLGTDRTVRVWDTRTLQATIAYETAQHTYDRPQAALLHDGKRVVVVEKSVVVRDRAKGDLLETLSTDIAGSVAASPDGRTVVFGTQAGKIEAYDVTATPAKKLWDYSAHDAAVHTVAFSPDGRRMASGGNDHRAFIWDVTGKEPKKLCETGAGGIPAGDENVYRIVWTPDGKSVVMTRGQRVQVWRISDKTAVLQDSFVVASGGTYLSKGMSLHPSLPWVAVAADKDRSSVVLWDYTTKTKLKEWSFPAGPTALEFAPDGRHLLTANPNGTIGVLRLDVPKAPADPNAPKLEFAAEWPGNRDPLPATEFVPAWNAPGVLAEVRGRGTIRFPRVEAKEFALDLELDLRGTGELSVQLGDSSDFRPELRLWEENGVGFARMVRVQNGKFFARATQAKIDRNCRLTLVASPAGTGLARGDGDVFRVTPASANATIQFTGRADTTNATIRSVRVRPATKLELANLAAKLGGAAAPETPGEDPADPDRAAAIWALGLKAQVVCDLGPRSVPVKAVSELPIEPFTLDRVDFAPGTALTDADLAKLEDLKRLRVVIATGTPIGDEGVKRLCQIITLTDLHLADTKLGDEGFAALTKLRNLRLLTVAGTAISGKVSTLFHDKSQLEDVNLHNTPVNHDLVWAVSHCPKLATLHLSSTKVTDTALAKLEACSSLRYLTLGKTGVTAAGVKKLAEALPLCKIEWDGGVIEPRVSQTRGLAFDGKSTYVKIPTALGGSEFPYTIEAWITPETVTGKSRHLFLFGEPGGGIGLSEKGSLGIGFKTPKEWMSDYGRSSLKPGERVHVAGVATANRFELFLNGRSDGIKPVQVGSLVGITPPALIGKHVQNSPEGYFHGTMHALRVSKSVRYTKPFAPDYAWKPDADTVAQYHFDEGTGAKLTDHSGNGHHGVIENSTWVK